MSKPISTILSTCMCVIDVQPDRIIIIGNVTYSIEKDTLSISSSKDVGTHILDTSDFSGPTSISYINVRGGTEIKVDASTCAESVAVRISYGGICFLGREELRNLDIKVTDGGEVSANKVSNKLSIDVVRKGKVRVHALQSCDVITSSTGDADIDIA